MISQSNGARAFQRERIVLGGIRRFKTTRMGLQWATILTLHCSEKRWLDRQDPMDAVQGVRPQCFLPTLADIGHQTSLGGWLSNWRKSRRASRNCLATEFAPGWQKNLA